MTNLKDIAAAAEKLDCVYSASIWNDRRVYVNLVGADRSYAGDRNLKVYWDAKSGWVIDGLKGIMTSECRESLNSFKSAMIG